jgi:hypothetical protein
MVPAEGEEARRGALARDDNARISISTHMTVPWRM